MEKNFNSLKSVYSRFLKDMVFDKYCRIVRPWKDYDKISRAKMLDDIIEVYSDYHNIIDICTLKELEFLKKVLKQDEDINDQKKYLFERESLKEKMLLMPVGMSIPGELIESITKALENYDEKIVKKKDRINEILVSTVRIYGQIIIDVLFQIVSPFFNKTDDIDTHIEENRLFNFYVYIDREKHENRDIFTFCYHEYFDYLDDLDYQRKTNAIAYDMEFDIKKMEKLYRNTFYYHFDISNKKISKMVNMIVENIPYYYSRAMKNINKCALLYDDVDYVINLVNRYMEFNKIKISKDEVGEIIEDALLEIPSGALNGLTPKEYFVKKEELDNSKRRKEKEYCKQTNACLSKKDADLFYKIYFALLEYTNNKYNINHKLKKIYKQQRLNPSDLIDIINKLWENPKTIIDSFVKDNVFKFNDEELELVSGFKNGIRSIFFMASFEEEYTLFCSKEDKTYMVKGIIDNIDNIINYRSLPVPVITTLLPFKEYIIYDSIFNEIPVVFGNSFYKLIEKSLDKNLKYYHL